MKPLNRLLPTFGLCTALWAAEAPAKKAAVPEQVSPEGHGPVNGIESVDYREHDIVTLHCRLRFTTVIVLPKAEKILDYVVGDKEFWVVDGAENLAFVKPAKAGAQTDLNLVTASGNIYSFVLIENGGAGQPDLKVFVNPQDESLLNSIQGQPKFVAATAVHDFEEQYKLAQRRALDAQMDADLKVQAAKVEAKQAEEKALAESMSKLEFGYRFDRNKAPFFVSAIYHDGKFTYIKANSAEPPALYELRDGKASLINFDFANGVYTAPKVIDEGYLQIGKKKMSFVRGDRKLAVKAAQ